MRAAQIISTKNLTCSKSPYLIHFLYFFIKKLYVIFQCDLSRKVISLRWKHLMEHGRVKMIDRQVVITLCIELALLLVLLSYPANSSIKQDQNGLITSSIFAIEEEPKIHPFSGVRFSKVYRKDKSDFTYFLELFIVYKFFDPRVVGNQLIDVRRIDEMIFDKRASVIIDGVLYDLTIKENEPDLLMPGTAVAHAVTQLPKEASLRIKSAKKIQFNFVFHIRRLQSQQWVVPKNVLAEWKKL